MILRRVIKHFRNQEWTAIALDFLIVVMGILIAFQITNWSTERADRNREQALIVRLDADFNDIQLWLRENIEHYNQNINATEYVYAAVAAETPPNGAEDNKRFEEALYNITISYLSAGSSSTFMEMQASGDVDLLQNTELKTALIEYHQDARVARDGFVILVDKAQQYYRPLFQAVRFGASTEITDGTSSYFISSFDFQKMTKDEQFLSSLSVLITVHANNRALQAQQLEQAMVVLDILQAEVLK